MQLSFSFSQWRCSFSFPFLVFVLCAQYAVDSQILSTFMSYMYIYTCVSIFLPLVTILFANSLEQKATSRPWIFVQSCFCFLTALPVSSFPTAPDPSKCWCVVFLCFKVWHFTLRDIRDSFLKPWAIWYEFSSHFFSYVPHSWSFIHSALPLLC